MDRIPGQTSDSPQKRSHPGTKFFNQNSHPTSASLTVPRRLLKRNTTKFVSTVENYPLQQPRTPHPSEEKKESLKHEVGEDNLSSAASLTTCTQNALRRNHVKQSQSFKLSGSVVSTASKSKSLC